MKWNKMAGLLLAALMLAGYATGCQKGDTASSAASPATASSATASSVTSPVGTLTVDGNVVDVPYVMKINGNEISLDEYRYYYLNLKGKMDGGDDSYWTDNTEAEEKLKQTVLDTIKSDYAVKVLAANNSISLEDKDYASVSSQLTSFKESYETEDAYQAMLSSSYMTESLCQSFLENSTLSSKVGTTLLAEDGKYQITEDEMREILATDYVRASHILIYFDTDGTDTQKKLAEEALKRAKAGEDFDSLVAEYGQDSGMTDNTDGYYFTYGEMVTEFEEAAFALEVGEVSEIVESQYGYHIIKRLPMEESYIEENMESLMSGYRSAQYNKEYKQVIADSSVEFGAYYDSINTATLA